MTEPRELVEAVEAMADVFAEADGAWLNLSCVEVDALAAVLRAADRHDAAAHVIEDHARGDYEGDDVHRAVLVEYVDGFTVATVEHSAGEFANLVALFGDEAAFLEAHGARVIAERFGNGCGDG